MKKQLLTLTLFLTSLVGFSQATNLYHSADDCLTLNASNTDGITYVVSEANPDSTFPVADPNTSAKVSSIVSSAVNSTLVLDLPTAAMPGSAFSFSIRFYSANAGTNGTGSGRLIVRMYNSVLGTASANREQLFSADKTGGEWQTATYTTENLPNTGGNITANGGFDRIIIIASNGAQTIEKFYFDDIKTSITPAAVTVLPGTPTLTSGNAWAYNHGTSDLNATVTSLRADAVVDATPSTSGNGAANVLKVTRTEANANSGAILTLDNSKYFNGASGNLKFRIFPKCNLNTSSNVKIRVNKDGAQGEFQISYATENLVQNKWNEVSIDLASSTPTTVTDNLYNTIFFLLNQGDSSEESNGAVFYIDAVQVPESVTLSTNNFDLKSFQVFPNPTTDSFQISSEQAITGVTLANVAGQVVKTFAPSENYNISDLNAGIYFATVTSANGTQTVKIVKK